MKHILLAILALVMSACGGGGLSERDMDAYEFEIKNAIERAEGAGIAARGLLALGAEVEGQRYIDEMTAWNEHAACLQEYRFDKKKIKEARTDCPRHSSTFKY